MGAIALRRTSRLRPTPGTRAEDIHQAIGHVISQHERQLGSDHRVSKVRVEVLFNQRTGTPQRVRFEACSETDLMEE